VEEVLSTWPTHPQGRYLDGTVGGGGHAAALLERYPQAELVGLDRDPEALEEAGRRLGGFGARVRLVHGDLGDLEEILAGIPGPPVVGILADLGVSSRQLDSPERGFSYLADGPLRLVLNRDADRGAGEVLDAVTEGELTRIFRELGELPGAARAARAVLRERDREPLRTTARLVAALEAGAVRSPRRLSQAFQALRLAVNDELGSLRRALAAAARVLPFGGTLTVISFESLMDREVKQALRPPRVGRPLPGVPDPEPTWELITRRVVRPSEAEVMRNPRSRSARLRAARRTGHVVA
jgi:16S rRNA (cytosine1402-N4)-methyltransferase